MPVDPTNPPNYITYPNAAIPVYVVSGSVVTVATLPSLAAGARSFVSDSTVAGTGNFGAAVVGLGTFTVPVWCDGSAWRIG